MVRSVLHLILHVLVPGVVARYAAHSRWRWAWTIMLLTMLVDLDHLLATPIYAPGRCSIGFHPLHQPFLFPLYGILGLFRKTRWVGVGLLIHMVLDGIDCIWMRLE